MMITILTLLASLCLIFQLVTCLMVMARKFLRTKGAVSAVKDWQNQGVTILRPVAGLENNLQRTHLNPDCRAILGPWGHIYPQDGIPGPAIGFLQECVRWWDHWLKDIDRGVADNPKMRSFICNSYEATASRDFTPGRWVGDKQWPSPNIEPVPYFLSSDLSLSSERGDGQSLKISSPLNHGKAGGEWMATGCAGEHPADQRLDDGGSLNFDSAVLAQGFDILGAPLVKLKFSVDKPVAQISLRLSDVRPDGQITRVSYQVFNLNHVKGHENPQLLEPGRLYHIDIALKCCGYHFGKGHKIRLSIGTGYWPLVWPAPQLTTLTIHSGQSALELPVRQATADDKQVEFLPAIHGQDAPISQLSQGIMHRYSSQDYVTGLHHYVTEGIGGLFGEGAQRFDEIGTMLDSSLKRHLTIDDSDPLSAKCEITQHYQIGREGWMFDIDTFTMLTSDAQNFYLKAKVTVKENGELAFERDWDEVFKRHFL